MIKFGKVRERSRTTAIAELVSKIPRDDVTPSPSAPSDARGLHFLEPGLGIGGARDLHFVVRRAISPCVIMAGSILCLVLGGVVRLGAQESGQEPEAAISPMVGQMAPAWSTQGWANSEPVELRQLRGKVVLLRFLNDSPSSAASLRELHRAYAARGLAVVGIYTPSPMPADTDLDHVRQLATSLGFEFPVGLDSRWETLNRYWLQQAAADVTAATFLIDRSGIIRYIQPNGQYEKTSANRTIRREYLKLEKEIETLLKPDESSASKAAENSKAKRFRENFQPRRSL